MSKAPIILTKFLEAKLQELSPILRDQNMYIEELKKYNDMISGFVQKGQKKEILQEFDNKREITNYQMNELGQIRIQNRYIYLTHMMAVSIVVFGVIYIGLMSVLQLDYLSFYSIIGAFVISYYMTTPLMKWFSANRFRNHDNWFGKYHERKISSSNE